MRAMSFSSSSAHDGGVATWLAVIVGMLFMVYLVGLGRRFRRWKDGSRGWGYSWKGMGTLSPCHGKA